MRGSERKKLCLSLVQRVSQVCYGGSTRNGDTSRSRPRRVEELPLQSEAVAVPSRRSTEQFANPQTSRGARERRVTSRDGANSGARSLAALARVFQTG